MAKLKKGKSLSIDFTGVEAGGRVVPDGEYTAKIVVAELTESSKGNDMIKLELKVTGPKAQGSKLYDNCSLLPQALFKLRTLLECAGMKVPDGAMDLDTDDLIGEEVGVSVINEIYEGKKRPKIEAYLTADMVSGDTEETGNAEGETEETDEGKEDETETEETDEPEEATGKAGKTRGSAAAADGATGGGSAKRKPAAGGKSKLKVGDKVSFRDDDSKKTITGKIVAIDGDTADINAKGEEWQVDISELTPA